MILVSASIANVARQQWIAEFRSWASAAEQDVRYDHQVMNDCESELLLRGEDPPHDRVRPEFKIIKAASDRIIRRLEKDPRRFIAADEQLGREVDQFREQLADRKKKS